MQTGFFQLTTALSLFLFAVCGLVPPTLADISEDGSSSLSSALLGSEIACGSSMTFTVAPEPLPEKVKRVFSSPNQTCPTYLRDVYPATAPVPEICAYLAKSGYGLGEISGLVSKRLAECNEKLENLTDNARCDSFRSEQCLPTECDKRPGPYSSCKLQISPDNLIALDTSTLHGTSRSCTIMCEFALTGYSAIPGTGTVSCTACSSNTLPVDFVGWEG